MKAVMEKMKSCPTPGRRQFPERRHLEVSDDAADHERRQRHRHRNFAGHAAHHSILTMTQSCANKDTGDSCDMAYTFDLWLANDDLPELATPSIPSTKNYVHKLGLDDTGGHGTAGDAHSVPGALQGRHEETGQ